MIADRLHGAAAGPTLLGAIAALLRGPLRGRHTLLAVCPNSAAVARAALRAAHEADAPVCYAATLNQVDRDGGYTGWTPETFTAFVRDEAQAIGFEGPIFFGLDHGGPWKKDRHVIDGYGYEASYAAVLQSIEACLDAGYALLHLDPTADLRLPAGTPVPVDAIVERTVALMRHAEAYRSRRGLPAVDYEVGTEEVGGGLESEERFSHFLSRLEEARRAAGLPAPCFVVGNVGTTLDTVTFDAARAQRLCREAARYGLLVKGHYTDGVDRPDAYPLAGMGGANVGPGFAAEEYAALLDLVRLEQRLGRNSRLSEALQRAVVESGRWKKWRRPDERDLPFEALPPTRRAWLIETGSRYVWTHPSVAEARQRLYRHVHDHRDADAFVLWRIKRGILRYLHAFNLIRFNARLLEALPASGLG